VASIEAAIDQLYQGPLGNFVEARTALARTLKGDDAKRVKALPKPTVVPWAVNQVYWHARPVYDRVVKSGAGLRAAQVAALEGHPADLREARAAHQKAIGAAVAEALRLAGAAGTHPSVDQLSRTFEALTLQKTPPGEPGRLVTVPEPAGFEALTGIPIAAPKPREQPPHGAPPSAPQSAWSFPTTAVPSLASKTGREATPMRGRELPPKEARRSTPTEARAGKTERDRAERDRSRKAADLRKADATVRRAEVAERRAHHAWETAKSALEKAVRAQALAALRARVDE
jgi:hypothetical protein